MLLQNKNMFTLILFMSTMSPIPTSKALSSTNVSDTQQIQTTMIRQCVGGRSSQYQWSRQKGKWKISRQMILRTAERNGNSASSIGA
ncbi:hypothetical protein B0H67DRAFT_566658, partial [Lasiosphaeris hirsuta]